MEVARLTPVDLREVWPNEAGDFTPWLAENLEALGEALGMDLELIQLEAPVGPFSVDILAKDINEGRNVVIENQLEATNHDHLGKVLTYAAGYNANVMVWIVRDFRDEHRQALDWLNQRTNEDTDFYGVVVRAIRIGDSAPAYDFDVVARPSSFQKTRPSTTGGSSSMRRQAYSNFWPRIIGRLRDEHHLTQSRATAKGNWINVATGVTGVIYGVVFTAKATKAARAELYLNSSNPNRNKALFDRLYEQLDSVHDKFGEPLQWERLNHAKASRIAVYLPDRTINDAEETLANTADWMVDTIVRLSRTVVPIVQETADEIDRELAEQTDEPLADDEDGDYE